LFALIDPRLEDYRTLGQCDPCYRLHVSDGSELTMTGQFNRLVENLEHSSRAAPRTRSEFIAHTG
jgi:hypothetical protein